VTRVLNVTPNGIDRIDFALARHFLAKSEAAGMRATGLGPRVLPGEKAHAAVEAIGAHWGEEAEPENDPGISASGRSYWGRHRRRRVGPRRGSRKGDNKAIAMPGQLFALCALLLASLLGAIRTRLRRRIVTALWGREFATGLAGFWTIDCWLRPLWWGFHAVCVFSAIGSRRIRWAGVDYIVRSPQDVDVIRHGVGNELSLRPAYKQESEQAQ
jgi:hypothetical protein